MHPQAENPFKLSTDCGSESPSLFHLYRTAARVIDFFIDSLPVHLHSGRSYAGLLPKALNTNNFAIKDLQSQNLSPRILMSSKDADYAFANISHADIPACWNKALSIMKDQGFSHAWVKPNKTMIREPSGALSCVQWQTPEGMTLSKKNTMASQRVFP